MRIVNLRHYRGSYIYCGRRLRFHRDLGPLEASPVGNPFLAGQEGPIVNCLRLYREWLHERIAEGSPLILGLFRELTDQSVLACWCTDLEGDAIFAAPEVCHCQVLIKGWRWWKNQQEAGNGTQQQHESGGQGSSANT